MLAAPNFGSHYDFIVCGSGSSGSVIARRLAEHPQVRVLLLEAGGSDDVPQVSDPLQWPVNLGSERDWGFTSEPSTALNGRSILLSMGKVLGGGSSINVMAWARGHKNDWDYYAAASGDNAWGYQSVLDIYRRIEDWHGVPDPSRHGTGGPVYVQSAPRPHPVACAAVAAAESMGIPSYDSHNGAMMEREGGASFWTSSSATDVASPYSLIRFAVSGPAESDSALRCTCDEGDLRWRSRHWRPIHPWRADAHRVGSRRRHPVLGCDPLPESTDAIRRRCCRRTDKVRHSGRR